MNSRNFSGQQLVHFRHWSRKSYAVFNSLNRVIKISRLNMAFSILTLAASSVFAQNDQQPFIDQDVDLDELEVTAQAEPLVFSHIGRVITTISKQEIESAPVSDLAELLSFVQSVDIRQRGGFGIQADVSIRGGSFDQVLVLINGIPISDPQTGHFNLNLPVDLSDIQKVEIIKGPAARIFGPNAFSGAINIITKAQDENSLAVRLNGGQKALYHFGATANVNVNNWQTRLSYDQKGSDGYMENTDFKSYQGFLQSSLQLKGLLLDAQLGFMQKDFGANSFYSSKYTMQYEKNQSRLASLGFHFGKKIRISILPFYRQHRDNWQLNRGNPELYQNFHQTDIFGARAKMIFYSKLGKTTFGINYSKENLLSSNMGYDLSEPENIPWSANHQFKKSYQREHTGLYFEQNKQIAEKWNISGGLLAHWYSGMKKEINIYPGLDISYQIQDHVRVFASANQAMRLPTFTDLFYSGPSNLGNSELKPEKSLTFELGAYYQKDAFEMKTALFRRYGSDIIDWVWQDSIWKTQNITKLTTNGFEISSQIHPNKQWNIKWWKKLSMDYTYLDLKKNESDILSKYALNNLRHQVNLSMQIQIRKHFFFQIQGTYKARLGSYQIYDFELETYENEPYQDYFSVNAKLTYQLNAFECFMEAKNLTDVQVVEFGVPQSGFWLIGGIKYRIIL